MTHRPRTLILSPYSGDTFRNIQYAKEACKDSVMRGEAPFASHLIYTQFLDDIIPYEREFGFDCEYSYLLVAQHCVAYTDLGWTPGMEKTQKAWLSFGRQRVEERTLGGVWESIT